MKYLIFLIFIFSVYLVSENINLEDTNNTLNGQSTTYKNIFLYQSMSGDAATGEASFTSKNSKIITNKGDSYIESLDNEDSTGSNINLNGYKLYVGGVEYKM